MDIHKGKMVCSACEVKSYSTLPGLAVAFLPGFSFHVLVKFDNLRGSVYGECRKIRERNIKKIRTLRRRENLLPFHFQALLRKISKSRHKTGGTL